MTRQKVLLLLAAVAFVGWLAYLGYAVVYHTWWHPPEIVSRSQLAGAPVLVVAKVTTTNGKPNPTVTVTHRLSAVGPTSGEIEVANLPDARPPSGGPFTGDGEYLLPLEPGLEPGGYRIAGWPRSPGVREFQPGEELKYVEEETGPDGKPRTVFKSYNPPQHIRHPLVYPWNPAVQAQVRKLGYSW